MWLRNIITKCRIIPKSSISKPKSHNVDKKNKNELSKGGVETEGSKNRYNSSCRTKKKAFEQKKHLIKNKQWNNLVAQKQEKKSRMLGKVLTRNNFLLYGLNCEYANLLFNVPP